MPCLVWIYSPEVIRSLGIMTSPFIHKSMPNKQKDYLPIFKDTEIYQGNGYNRSPNHAMAEHHIPIFTLII